MCSHTDDIECHGKDFLKGLCLIIFESFFEVIGRCNNFQILFQINAARKITAWWESQDSLMTQTRLFIKHMQCGVSISLCCFSITENKFSQSPPWSSSVLPVANGSWSLNFKCGSQKWAKDITVRYYCVTLNSSEVDVFQSPVLGYLYQPPNKNLMKFNSSRLKMASSRLLQHDFQVIVLYSRS